MRASTWLVVAAVTSACGESAPDVSWQSIEGLQYAVPVGWAVRDQSEQTRKILVWTPDENGNKESVTVIRTQPLVNLTKVGLPRMRGLLAAASKGLSKGSFSEPTQVQTSRGFVGMRVDGQFVPPGTSSPYRRIHVVMLDGTSLVHVLYTSRNLSADPEALRVVLETLHRKAA